MPDDAAALRFAAPRPKAQNVMTNAPDPSRPGADRPQVKPWIDAIAPYVPGRSSTGNERKTVKLSSNENPFGTPESARAAWEREATSLHRYPDAGATALREALAAKYGLDPMRVIYGTGSDEILHLVAGAFAGPGDEILFQRYGFSVYPIAARRVGATPVEAPDSGYGLDVDAMLACVTPRTRVVYLANPNNPTGTLAGRADIARLHAALPADVLLVMDHAYAEYLTDGEDDGGLELARNAPNVLVTRTFSKIFGLAAERIGWGYGPAHVIDALHRIRAPFCVTTAGQEAAIAALNDDDFVAICRSHNRKWLSWFEDEIRTMGNAGLAAVPSSANFSLVTFAPDGPVTAENTYNALMEAGYITRWLPGQGLPHALRITIGTEEDMRGLVDVLRAHVSGAGR